MEQNCPVTSTVSNPVGSPKPPLLTSCANASSPKVERESPEPNCAICLGKTENKSFTDSCLHQFCFSCLLEWSKVKAECPLCKQSFKSIIHNVRSNEEYEEYHVEVARETRFWQEEPSVVRFRYSTTLTPERQRERFLESLVGPFFFGTDAIPARRINNRRRYRNATGEFRASIYRENLWVNPLPDVTGRYRECSPEFYRLNPAQLHRLVPWLNRELNVLRVPSTHLMVVVDLILGLLTQYPINSMEFHARLQPHIGANTAHFVHEFYAFARSPYDMVGFDQSADYQHRPGYSTEVQAIESDSDSDIIVLSPTPPVAAAGSSSAASSSAALPPPLPPPSSFGPSTPPGPAPLSPSLSPLSLSSVPVQNDTQPLNLSASSSRPVQRLSPIAGPSSLDEDFILMITRELQNPTYPSYERVNTMRIFTQAGSSREIQAQTVESDSDDCVIVGYVKPRHERTPEIVTLNSDIGSNDGDRGSDSSTESLKLLLSSSSPTSLSDSSDDEYIPNQTRHKRNTSSKRKKVRRVTSSSSDESNSTDTRKPYVSSSDSDTDNENMKHKKSKSKGKHKKIAAPCRGSTSGRIDKNKNKSKKLRKEVWRIVRKQEPETDHDYSLDCYDPPYTEDEWASLSTDRPKLRSIVITKSAGSNGQREASYSSVASSSRSSSHYRDKRHKHKSHKRDVKKRKEKRRSESSSPVRSSKGKKSKCKRSHRIEDSSS